MNPAPAASTLDPSGRAAPRRWRRRLLQALVLVTLTTAVLSRKGIGLILAISPRPSGLPFHSDMGLVKQT